MNQHQEPVHLNYCGRLDAIDPKQRIVFSLFLFSLGFARSRKIYQKKSREIWDKQTLHLGHLLQVPTQLTGVSCTPWIPLGHCRVRLHVSHVSQRHSNFYTSCNHLQSSAIRLHQPECLCTPQRIPMWIHFGSFQQVFEIHFGVSNSAHAPKHSRSFLSCALPSLFNFHKVPLNCGACDCGTVVARPSG